MEAFETKTILISPDGDIVSVYDESAPIANMGPSEMERISNVTWNHENQCWQVHLLKGPEEGKTVINPDWTRRSDAIKWEIDYFNRNVDVLMF